MGDLVKWSASVQRITTSLLRAAGGRSVVLKIPQPAVAGSISEELGLAVPLFDAIELFPVVLREVSSNRGVTNSGGQWELLTEAGALGAAAGSLEHNDVLLFLTTVAGVVADDVCYEIVDVGYSGVGCVPYLYRLALRAPDNTAI